MKRTLRFAGVATAIAIVAVCSVDSVAYVASGPTWNLAQVPYYVNGANLDLSAASAVTAVRAGADTWHLQSGAGFQFAFAGASSQTTTTYDSVNLIVFRNASSGSAIGTTYWWSSGSRIVDADIVFWDGAFRFFAGTSGCSSGFYIEDIATHEFGHALGLGHSDSALATMYYATSSCSTNNRSLDTDDVAGVRALYPPPALRAPTGFHIVISRPPA